LKYSSPGTSSQLCEPKVRESEQGFRCLVFFPEYSSTSTLNSGFKSKINKNTKIFIYKKLIIHKIFKIFPFQRAEKFPSGRGEDEAGQQQPGTTASILSRERKRKQADSLRNSDASDDDGVEVIQHIRREEADEDQDGEKEDDTRQEEVEEEELIKIQGRLAGRVKRIHKVATKRQRKNSKRNLITYDAGGDEEEVAAVDELPEDEEEENFNAERFAQILDGKGDGGTRNVSDLP
jgi:hypothetical protein